MEIQGGLRAEYATQDFALADESFPHDYTSLFPSAIAVWNANESTRLKASFSRRINRPGTRQLNPFPVFFDTQNVFLGNPELDPEYTDAFELGYTKSGELGSLQVTPYYRHTTDVIRFLIDTEAVIDGREMTTVSFENLDRSDSYGADVNGSFRTGPFNGFASFNVYKMKTDGGSVTDLSSDAVTWSTRVNGSYKLTPATTLQGMMFYRAPMEFETGEFSSFKATTTAGGSSRSRHQETERRRRPAGRSERPRSWRGRFAFRTTTAPDPRTPTARPPCTRRGRLPRRPPAGARGRSAAR